MLPSVQPAPRAFSRYAEHQATEEARPDRRARAHREHPLPLDRQDADEAASGRGRGRRRGEDRGASTRCSSRMVDRAAAQGALHANTAARKKAQAAQLVAGSCRWPSCVARDRDERALELELGGEPAAALQREVEVGEVGDRRRAARPPRSCAPARRPSRRRTGASSAGRPRRAGGPLGVEALAGLDAADVCGEERGEQQELAGAGPRSSARGSPRTRARTPATSRLPHASVSANGGTSARAETSSSTSSLGDPSWPAQVESLSISLASSCEVLTDELDERAARLAGRLDAVAGELLGDPLRQLALRAPRRRGARPSCAQAFASGDVLAAGSSRDEREHGVGRGRGEVLRDRLCVRRLPRARPRRRATSRPPLAKRPIALQAATASSPVVSRAESRSTASSPNRSRRRRRARSIFGAVAAGEQIGRFELVRHERQA